MKCKSIFNLHMCTVKPQQVSFKSCSLFLILEFLPCRNLTVTIFPYMNYFIQSCKLLTHPGTKQSLSCCLAPLYLLCFLTFIRRLFIGRHENKSAFELFMLQQGFYTSYTEAPLFHSAMQKAYSHTTLHNLKQLNHV